MVRTLWAALGVALCSPHVVLGTVLTLDDALARARREAPTILAARLRPDEARGRLAGASALLRDNPVVEAAGGRRHSERGTSTDIDTSLTQTFELGGQRRARMTGARAAVYRETAGVEDTVRQLLADVATTFLRTVATGERRHILRANEDVAVGLLRVAERRHQAGDIADLDVNLARVVASRARADLRAGEALLQRGLGELRVLLGMDPGEVFELRGDLRSRPVPSLAELLTSAADRPDLRARASELREAEADAQLGDGFTWPDVGVRLGYQREEGADIPLAGLSVSLPIFARGQELRATGAVRARRLRLELAAQRRAIETEVRAAFEAYERLADGADVLQRDALPLLDDNDSLARRSFEAGELSLTDYLVVRREMLEARIDQVDRSLEAALAAIDLEARAGVLR